MTEYPSKTCGPCPALGSFEKKKSSNTLSYLDQNTIPEPKVKFQEGCHLNEYKLSVTAGDQPPDLRVSPLQNIEGSQQHPKTCCGCPQTNIYDLPPKVNHDYSPPLKKPLQHPSHVKNDRPQGILNNKGDVQKRPACYLPQPEDTVVAQQSNEYGPTGYWATGKADWGHLGGLTGTRPAVDKYSITRFSEGEWRSHNSGVFDRTESEQHRADLINWNSLRCMEQTQNDADKNQADNTRRLNQRKSEINRWKCELERAIAAAAEEIRFIEEQRARLKRVSSVLQMPESIAGECLDRRTGRLDSELVRDEVEEELIRELSLCAEIRDLFARTLKDVEKQLLEDKTAKQKLECDWTDKKDAHEIDAVCASLNKKSTTLMFKPGAVTFPEEQSTPEYWEHFTKEALIEGEAARQRSVTLRSTLDAIVLNAARDLRAQADRVELALAKRISCLHECLKTLEEELKKVLQQLADVEDSINNLKAAIRRMDIPMKKAQTRLDCRLQRPRVENCRDAVHFGLIEEVKTIAEQVAALQAQLGQALKSQESLINIRSDLEREIILKRKTLEIDAERIVKVRSFYPSATALEGH